MTRAQFYETEHLRTILDMVLAGIPNAQRFGVYLEGSIAEGFGNSTSDIDFVLLDPSDVDYPAMPTLHFVAGHRVEVRTRSAHELERQLALVCAYAQDGRERPPWGLDEEVLDRCQRFRNGLVLAGTQAEVLKDKLPPTVLSRAVQKWFTSRYRVSLATARLCDLLMRPSEATAYGRAALAEAAKVYLAGFGETYLAKKWISRQFLRQPATAHAREAFERLEQGRGFASVREHLDAIAGFIGEMLPGVVLAEAPLTLARRPGVTNWRIGSVLHVLRGAGDVFALGQDAEEAWRKVRFGQRVEEIVNGSDDPRSVAGCLYAFYQLGLIGVNHAGRPLRRPAVSPPPSGGRPILGIEGLPVGDAPQGIRLAPFPARRFAACGMELAYVNMVVENAREDATGALNAGQWKVVERSVRRMLRSACQAVLSANGVHPLPQPEEACATLAEIGLVDADLAQAIAELDAAASADEADSAAALLGRTEWTICRLREQTGAQFFPRSFAAKGEWARTLAIGYDWARLGAYLDADFPINQARELISSGSQRPDLAPVPA